MKALIETKKALLESMKALIGIAHKIVSLKEKKQASIFPDNNGAVLV